MRWTPSPGGKRGDAGRGPVPDDRILQQIATATTILVYGQILVGAPMRHTDAGLAIPDFPLAFGHLIPPSWDPKIAVHFAHRVGALVAGALSVPTAGHVL